MRGNAFDPQKFWGDWPPPGDPARLPDLTPEMVTRAEAWFGIALPRSYLDLLKVRNGGSTQRFVFAIASAHSWVGDHLEVNHLNGIGVVQPEPPAFRDWDGSYNISMGRYMIHE